MSHVDEAQCERFGLDAKRVESIARRLDKAGQDAHAIGLVVFGGSGTGSLRFFRAGHGHDAEVAHIGEHFDGGDGGDE